MYPIIVNTIFTSHSLKQMIKFYVFHGCKHDGIPKCDLNDKNRPEDDYL